MGFRQGMPLQRAWKASERRFPLQCRLEHAPYFYCDPKTETEQTKGIVRRRSLSGTCSRKS